MTERKGIAVASLEAWFGDHVPDTTRPLHFDLIAGGHSNLTYRVTDTAGRRYALRRPPLGDFPRGAHDVLREHRILQALQATPVPVPVVVAQCADVSVTGAPFYVMEWVDGAIVDRPAAADPSLPDDGARRR